VLILVGWKLSSPKIWKEMWSHGPSQFVPFAATIVGVLTTDLLRGTLLGAAVGLFFSVRAQQKNALLVTKDKSSYLITFLKDMTFLQRPALKEALRQIPDGSYVAIDQRRIAFADHDIETLIANFSHESRARDIRLDVLHSPVQVTPHLASNSKAPL
jgi:MFS superfamily sulfate permease-like transporter